jgi:hypothetical protein
MAMNLIGIVAVLVIVVASVTLFLSLRRRQPDRNALENKDETLPIGANSWGRKSKVSLESYLEDGSARLVHPNSNVGPSTIDVPVSGHYLHLTIKSLESVHTVTVNLIARVNIILPLGHAEILTRPQLPSAEPHFEIFLDERPPLIRQAIGMGDVLIHPETTLPFSIEPGNSRSLILVPLTNSDGLMIWQLVIEISTPKGQSTLIGKMYITGDSGWVAYDQQGRESVPAPMANHWPLRPVSP